MVGPRCAVLGKAFIQKSWIRYRHHERRYTMKVSVIHGPRDVRFEERDFPKIIKPTDAIIKISATCVCGSDLWPYRGINPITQPTPMGHEYCGIVEEVGSAVTKVRR